MPIEFTGTGRLQTDSGFELEDITLLTLMAWMRIDVDNNGSHFLVKANEMDIFITGSFAGNTMRMFYERASDGGDTGEWATDVDSIKQSVPFHFALVHDVTTFASSVAKLFLNGIEQTNVIQVPTGVVNTDNHTPIIANVNGGTSPLGGLLADVRAYLRILTDAEIMAIYSQRGGDGIVDGLVVRHMLDERVDGQTGTTPPPFDLSIDKRAHTFPASVTGRADIFGLTQRRRAPSILA